MGHFFMGQTGSREGERGNGRVLQRIHAEGGNIRRGNKVKGMLKCRGMQAMKIFLYRLLDTIIIQCCSFPAFKSHLFLKYFAFLFICNSREKFMKLHSTFLGYWKQILWYDSFSAFSCYHLQATPHFITFYLPFYIQSIIIFYKSFFF